MFQWIKDRLSHKLEHISLSSIKATFREHGLALVVIIIGWEIIEDLLFPLMFGYLGKVVHPGFFALIPASILFCLHWLVVPFLWATWIKVTGKKAKEVHSCNHEH